MLIIRLDDIGWVDRAFWNRIGRFLNVKRAFLISLITVGTTHPDVSFGDVSDVVGSLTY